MEYTKTKKKSIVCLVFLFFVSLVLSSVVAVYEYKSYVYENAVGNAGDIAAICSKYLSLQPMYELLENPGGSAAFSEGSNFLYSVKESVKDIDYLRVLNIDENRDVKCIYDIYTTAEKQAVFVYEYPYGTQVPIDWDDFEPIYERYVIGIYGDASYFVQEDGTERVYAYSAIKTDAKKYPCVVVQVVINMQKYDRDILTFGIYSVLALLVCHVFGLVILYHYLKVGILGPVKKQNEYLASIDMPSDRVSSLERIKWIAESALENKRLLQQTEEEKNKISAELELATHMRMDLLPHIVPAFPSNANIEMAARLEPSGDSGEAFYDFFMVDEENLAIVSANVEGGGVSAALFMVVAKTLIKNHLQSGMSPQDVLDVTNNQLCDNNNAALFVSVWIGLLNVKTRHMIYAVASHPAPILVGADGNYQSMDIPEESMPIGVWEDTPYVNYEMTIDQGTFVAVYNAGLTLAQNDKGETYGVERVNKIIHDSGTKSVDEITSILLNDWGSFLNDESQKQDFSFVLFKI